MSKTLVNTIMDHGGSLQQIEVYVDVKFSRLGVPFGYGLVAVQDEQIIWSFGARELGFYDRHMEKDYKYLENLVCLDHVVNNLHELNESLAAHLLHIERLDFVAYMKRGGPGRGRLLVHANRMTLIYLNMLLPEERFNGFAFVAIDAKSDVMKARAELEGFTGFPYNPLQWAQTAALIANT